MSHQQQYGLLPCSMQGGVNHETTMKLPRNALVWCVLIVCLTLLIFTCLTRNRLCEIRLKDGNREVAANLAYESNGK